MGEVQQARDQTHEAAKASVAVSSAQGRAGHPMLGLQRLAGNAAVSRLVVQREDEEATGADGAATGAFDPEAIISDMAAGAVGGDTGTTVAEEAAAGEVVQARRDPGLAVQRDPPATDDPSATTKAAGIPDLLKALAAWGPFKAALDAFKAEVDKGVAQTTGGNATPRSVFFTVAGLGAAVATAQPIPIKPYLSITVDPVGKKGMVTLDVGKLAHIPGFDGGAPAPGPPGAIDSPGHF